MDFIVGQTYERGTDIHARFGGQRQSGIVTPSEGPYIFLFTGSTGTHYGYSDDWDDDGVFIYTGEGQEGDMTFVRGNRAIRDHAQDGKDLLLFEALGKGKGIKFMGTFACASWEYRRGPDKNGADRQLIVFHLNPVEVVGSGDGTDAPQPSTQQSLSALRDKAYQASTAAVQGQERNAKANYYQRSAAVRDYVLARAKGICEACKELAPFKRTNGTPYLEPHHIRRVSDGGPDDPRWVAAICPNCHRECHFGDNKTQLNAMLLSRVEELENEIGHH
jgi:5-methylcytosine-specific restriction protein A